MSQNNSIMEHKSNDVLSPAEVTNQVQLIQQIMSNNMKEGEHFGKTPGCGDKPSLYKAGAEKICLTFRLRPEYEIDRYESSNGQREYEVKCKIFSVVTGACLGEGVGNCTTMESKYRFRTGPIEETGKPIPKEYWDLRDSNPLKALESIGGKGHKVKKIDNVWQIVKQGEKVENDNPADQYNTVKKMAKKRAFVDAVLTATAASDIFTQDIEDITQNAKGQPDINNVENAEYEDVPHNATSSKSQNNAPSNEDKEVENKTKEMALEEALVKISSGTHWNGKVYAGSSIYLDNKKYTLTEEGLKQFEEAWDESQVAIMNSIKD